MYGIDNTKKQFPFELAQKELPVSYVMNSYSLLGQGYTDTENTVAAALRALGYTTGMTGKWHLSVPDEGGSFDCSYSQQTDSVKEAGFDFVDGLYIKFPCAGGFPHNLEWTVVEALRFMDNAMRSHKPFFLYFNPTPPHSPGVTESLLRKGAIYETPRGALSELPDVSKYCSSCKFAPRWAIWESTANISSLSRLTLCRDGLASLRWLDESLGVLYDFLSERGAIANTYIVMMTDHGRAKHTLYEEGTRVPMYAVGPSIFAGTVVDELVSHVDLAPTLLEWAAGDASQRIAVDGKSWAALASGKASSLDRGGIYTEILFDRAFLASDGMKYYNCSTTKILEREGISKTFSSDLAVSVGSGYPHLYEENQVYNLSADPTEQVNLWSLKGELPP
jgi:arylsulfatase A-like enzyme